MKKKKVTIQSLLDYYIENKTNSIFAKTLNIPQEELSNSMTIQNQTFSFLFRPNNYRRKIQTKTKDNSAEKRILSTIGTINPHTHIITVKNYKENITMQYGKDNLVAIYSCPRIHGKKQTYLIKRTTIPQINERISQISTNIKNRLDNALKDFSHKFGLSLPFKRPTWIRHENWLKGDEFLDSLPKECIIHDTIGKKVYAKGWEFIGGKDVEPTTTIKTYIKNRALENIAPEIVQSLSELSARFDFIGTKIANIMAERIKIDGELMVNLKTHNRVFKKLDRLLSQSDLRKWL